MASIDNIKKSKTGRPPIDTEAITLRLPRETIESIDGFRRHAMDVPTRPEAIRRLLKAGMTVSVLADELIGELRSDYRLSKENPRAMSLIQQLDEHLRELYVAATVGDKDKP